MWWIGCLLGPHIVVAFKTILKSIYFLLTVHVWKFIRNLDFLREIRNQDLFIQMETSKHTWSQHRYYLIKFDGLLSAFFWCWVPRRHRSVLDASCLWSSDMSESILNRLQSCFWSAGRPSVACVLKPTMSQRMHWEIFSAHALGVFLSVMCYDVLV